MAEQRSFVVRPLPGAALEGAFRVHLAPDALDKLNLKVGDLCRIISDDTISNGYGIAWRATDKMGNSPRLRPAKMSDTLRSAFNFAEGSHVTIEATQAKVYRADKIVLSDVTPATNGIVPSIADSEDKSWLWRCGYLLANCEAFTTGITFDVDGKRKALKKRFYVDRIDSPDAKPGEAALYRCDDDTKVVFNDGSVTPTQVVSHDDFLPCLDTARIGGLVTQVKELNKRLDRLLSRSRRASMPAGSSPHILLHGYEGTGKSMLLDRIEDRVAARTFRLDAAKLTGGITSKNLALIQHTFKDALANQPSVILMDSLDEAVPADDKVYSHALQTEFTGLRNTGVLVIATARNPGDISPRLRGAGRLSINIELPVPDVNARREILNVLRNRRADANDPLSAAISLKTHAFTPGDLAHLTEIASDHAMERQDEMRGEWISIQARASMLEASTPSYVDGSVHSQATTDVENELSRLNLQNGYHLEDNEFDILTEDFELALKQVKPTALREIFLETPKITWADIGGSEAVKQRFDEVIGWPFYYSERVEEAGVRPQRGVLLYGPPGCSKTLTAQAVANTYDLNFIAVKGAELISMYVGESERAVREVFRKARQAAPCVIFFDEIDSIGGEREGSSTKGLNVLTTLLNEMDGFEELKDVMVLAATNRPETLDTALLRPGRFDSHIYLGPPNENARRAIIDLSMKQHAIPDTVRYTLVAATEGYSGAEIVHICNMAKMNVLRRSIETGAESKAQERDFALALKQTNRGITKEMLEAYDAFANRGL